MSAHDPGDGPEPGVPLALENLHGWLVARYATIDSTNDEARRRLDRALPGERGVVAAAEQTKGRGTRGRTWISPAGCGLYCSRWERGPAPVRVDRVPRGAGVDAPTAVVLAAALGAAEAVERACAHAGLRVPDGLAYDAGELLAHADGRAAPAWIRTEPVNDLVILMPTSTREPEVVRKLGGILVETVLRDGVLDGLVVGVGLNTRAAARPVREEARADGGDDVREPIAIEDVTGAPPVGFETRTLLPELVRRLDVWITRLRTGGPGPVEAAFRRRSVAG